LWTMFGLEILCSVAIFYIFSRLFRVNYYKEGLAVLRDKYFLICVFLMATHTTMDPYFSLLTVHFKT